MSSLQPDEPVQLAQCGRVVARARHCYAIPTCYVCLPPPEPLEIIELPMNAREARTKAEDGLSGSITDQQFNHVLDRIEEQAAKGKFSLPTPFVGLGSIRYPSEDEREAVFDRLRAEGYKIKHHPALSSKDPREGAWDEITW